MEVKGATLLYTLAGLMITFAGFSALLLAVRPAAGARSSLLDRYHYATTHGGVGTALAPLTCHTGRTEQAHFEFSGQFVALDHQIVFEGDGDGLGDLHVPFQAVAGESALEA